MNRVRRRFFAQGSLLPLALCTPAQSIAQQNAQAGATKQPQSPLPAAPAPPWPLDLDVPFVVTPDNVVLTMLDMAQVSSRDRVLDLGSGDGRIVITAAVRYGADARGVEVDPSLVERARANAIRAGVEARARFEVRDLFQTDLGWATTITMYLLPDVNLQLRPLLLGLRPGTRVVSHDWDMGDWAPDQQQTVDAPDKKIGLAKVARLMLWIVPANVAGVHRGDGAEMTLVQRYQRVHDTSAQIGNRRFSFGAATVLGPSVTLLGSDAAGAQASLSTYLAQQPAAGSAIDWRLRVANEPERRITTTLQR